MTDNDPWAEQQEQQNAGSRQEAYGNAPSGLFGSEGGAPSLFNKSHAVGTERTGIISKAPYSQQRTKRGTNEPLFWGIDNKPKILNEGGQSNRPVNDDVIEIDTEYVMDQAEAAILDRDEPYEGGERRVFVGRERKAFKEAIKDAVKRGIRLTCDEDMVGKRLTVKRVATQKNPHGGDPIKVHAYRIDNA